MPREVHRAQGEIRGPGATKAIAEKARLGKGRLRGTAGEGSDARHEVRPDVRGTGHGTRADIMGNEVIVRVLAVQAHESCSREEAGQASRLVELGETRGCKGSRAHSRGGASKDGSRRIATTDSGMPHMENVSGDVGIGEVNRRPARRNKVQIHAGERELKPAARARQGRGASGGTGPPEGRRQTRRVVVQEVGDAVEVRRQAILRLVSRVRGHVTQVTREVVGASSRRRGSSEQSSRGSLTGEAPLGKRSRGELLGTEDGRSPSERPKGLTKNPNVVGRNGEAREGHLPFGQGGRGRWKKGRGIA